MFCELFSAAGFVLQSYTTFLAPGHAVVSLDLCFVVFFVQLFIPGATPLSDAIVLIAIDSHHFWGVCGAGGILITKADA